ncbi:hypothetical protein GCM10027419_07700 [Pandoraea terrae]
MRRAPASGTCRRLARRTFACLMVCVSSAVGAATSPQQQDVLNGGCAALAGQVAAVPGKGPLWLTSYASSQGELPPALRNAAFLYDNALAGIALVACHRVDDARRIADAAVAAVDRDRHYHDGRLRNAYRGGVVGPGPLALPGWWDAPSQRWFEDEYQTGTATGNVAWAALMLLTVYDATGERRYLDTAAKAMGWVAGNVYDATPPAGYIGGFFGEEPNPIRQTWKSTEHNVDTYAAFQWLARATGDARWREPAARARTFVTAMWQPGEGRFIIGTGEDGHTPNSGPSAIDAVLWPLIAVDHPPQQWRAAIDWANTRHRTGGGYGFNANPDGVWTEGTAQAAFVLQATGHADDANPLWPLLQSQRAPSGLLYATPEPRIRTGLSIGPKSKTPDFFYFHLPHLGATAWAVLAAANWNPFQPNRTAAPREAAPSRE